jgi:hypothetical protein
MNRCFAVQRSAAFPLKPNWRSNSLDRFDKRLETPARKWRHWSRGEETSSIEFFRKSTQENRIALKCAQPRTFTMHVEQTMQCTDYILNGLNSALVDTSCSLSDIPFNTMGDDSRIILSGIGSSIVWIGSMLKLSATPVAV